MRARSSLLIADLGSLRVLAIMTCSFGDIMVKNRRCVGICLGCLCGRNVGSSWQCFVSSDNGRSLDHIV